MLYHLMLLSRTRKYNDFPVLSANFVWEFAPSVSGLTGLWGSGHECPDGQEMHPMLFRRF